MRFFGGLGGGSDLHRDFHSTPDLNVQVQSSSLLAPKCHRSQEDVNALSGRNGLPPPNHPPPPPPVGQVVKVNVGANVPDVVTPASVYDNMAHIQQVKELAAATVEGGYGVMSSFRPSNSAKLYASPEDMKTVGYRSRSLPANRPHLRKSHSLRNPPNSSMFKSTGSQQALNNNVGNMNSNGNGNNQYAQPLKTTRSHSTAGIRERKKKTVILNASSSVTNLSSIASGTNGTTVPPNSAPPIPEPDYSLSESENDEGEDDETDEDGESEIAKELEKAAAREKLEATRETSGNSNTSGSSSSGSGSLPHSFSVEEIQKVRTQLKSSKSHPNDFLLQTQQSLVEDGDNSSSGVSSDQDVPVGPPMGFDDTAVRNLANQENNQHLGGAALLTGINPIDKESNQTKRPGYGGSGLLTRHAVSLAQLPPPIEADAEEQNNDLFVPPPPEFNAGPSAGGQDQEVMVFAPPPQFCDNKQHQQQQQQQTASQNRVKIIGAIPKVGGNQVKASGGRALP